MRRDLALRGAVVALLAAGGGIATGFIEREAGASNAIWFYGLIAACVVGLLSGYLAFRRPAAALRTVSEAAGQIGEGELAQRVPETSGPAGDLLHSFNVMAGRIEQLFDSVAAEHARLEAVFDASSDGMVACGSSTLPLSRSSRNRCLSPLAARLSRRRGTTSWTRSSGG
jgi:methyl-accepting chemotaxis protein